MSSAVRATHSSTQIKVAQEREVTECQEDVTGGHVLQVDGSASKVSHTSEQRQERAYQIQHHGT